MPQCRLSLKEMVKSFEQNVNPTAVLFQCSAVKLFQKPMPVIFIQSHSCYCLYARSYYAEEQVIAAVYIIQLFAVLHTLTVIPDKFILSQFTLGLSKGRAPAPDVQRVPIFSISHSSVCFLPFFSETG
jgi:hypothetical protein